CPSPSHSPVDRDANASPVAEGDAELLSLVEPGEQPDEVRDAFTRWNELAKRVGLPVARTLDGGRPRQIGARLKDGGLEAWAQALLAVEQSKHCRGENDRGWRADLDFICQPKSWRRLLEG